MEVLEEIKIVKADFEDAGLICELGAKTFIEAYKEQTSMEDMAIYNALNFNIEKIIKEFNEKNASFYLSYFNQIPAGYAKVRTVVKPKALKGLRNIEIERTYVLKQFQGRNIGPKLIQQCISSAVMENYEVIWLGVWDQNIKAIEFYKKMGFEIFGKRNFPFGREIHLNYLMKKEL